MPKKIRVYELAHELGLTNKEALDLCLSLGMGVKSHSSSVEDAQADRAGSDSRRRYGSALTTCQFFSYCIGGFLMRTFSEQQAVPLPRL